MKEQFMYTLWDESFSVDKGILVWHRLTHTLLETYKGKIQDYVSRVSEGIPIKVTGNYNISGKTEYKVLPEAWNNLDQLVEDINETEKIVCCELRKYGVILNPNWREINAPWIQKVNDIKTDFTEFQGKSFANAAKHCETVYNRAYNEELAKDYGLGFGILSSSLTAHLLYAAQSTAKEMKDKERALSAASKAIGNDPLGTVSQQMFSEMYPYYQEKVFPSMMNVLIEYFSYIGEIFAQALGTTKDIAEQTFSQAKSDAILNQATNIGKSTIIEALKMYPDNGAVIGYAVINDLLDDELCEYGTKAGNVFDELLVTWGTTKLTEIYKRGRLFNKSIINEENRKIIDGLAHYYEIKDDELSDSNDWNDILQIVFEKEIEDIDETLYAICTLNKSQLDKFAQENKRFSISRTIIDNAVSLYNVTHESVVTKMFIKAGFRGEITAKQVEDFIDLTNQRIAKRHEEILQERAEQKRREAQEQAKRNAEEAEKRRIAAEKAAAIQAEKDKKLQAILKKVKIAAIIVSIPIVIAIGFLIVKNAIIIPNQKYDAAMELLVAGNYTDACDAFSALGGYRDSEKQVAVCVNAINEQKYLDAFKLLQQGMFDDAINAFSAIVDYKDSQNKITEAYIGKAESYVQDGEFAKAAIAYGKANDFEKSSEYWQKVIQKPTIATSREHIVGIKANGTVVAVGENSDGQCNVSKWTNIVSVSVGDYHTVGLKNDGTVVAVGSNSHGQCNVSSWTDIIAIAAYDKHTLGLKSDGTVVAAGINTKAFDTSGWKDIVAITAGGGAYAVGVKMDGTVIAVGWEYGDECNVSEWKDIVAVSASEYHTVGLTADGRVFATGKNNEGQCNVSGWRDIVSVSTGYERTIGTKRDGTVVVVGGGWMHSSSPSEMSKWENIVSTASYTYCVMGLRADGVVVSVDYFGEEKQPAAEWTSILVPDQLSADDMLITKYKEAERLFSEEKYSEALSIFRQLTGYKESNEYIDKCVVLIRQNAQRGDVIAFGKYEQNRGVNGKEDIEWVVLDNSNSVLLLISKDYLDFRPYHSSKTNITWENSSIRKWLNSEFYDAAFNQDEKSVILLSHNINDDNKTFGTDGGNATDDYVFFLSVDEANKYVGNEWYRHAEAADAIKNKGPSLESFYSWWLRTPCTDSKSACAAGTMSDSPLGEWGWAVHNETTGIRPVIRITISND